MALSLADRLAVEDLLGRYLRALEDPEIGTEDEFAEIFTEDAVIDSPLAGTFTGADGVRAWARQTHRAERRTVLRRHCVCNMLVEGDGITATINAYFMLYTTPRAGEGRATTFELVGDYDCVARKVGGKWRMQRRTVTFAHEGGEATSDMERPAGPSPSES